MTARDELIEVMAEAIAFAEQLHDEEYRVQHGAAAAFVWIEDRFGKVMIQRYDMDDREHTYTARIFSAGKLVPPSPPHTGPRGERS